MDIINLLYYLYTYNFFIIKLDKREVNGMKKILKFFAGLCSVFTLASAK